MAKSKIKVKVVEITNNLLLLKPMLYKPALQTPTVVSSEKFIENNDGTEDDHEYEAGETIVSIRTNGSP